MKYESRWTPVRNRFWSQVQKTASCWLWIGATREDGYGIISVNGRPTRAHRYSWTMHRGEIPNGLHVLHRCDTPACVNPDHLFLGTNADNVADREAKGRGSPPPDVHHRGDDHPSSKLTEAIVREIRASYRPRVVTQAELAKRYGVSEAAVWAVLHGQNWRHVA